MAKDDLVRLRHMKDSAKEAVELIQGKSRSDLDTNRVICLALIRLLEVLGEAANRVTTATRQKNPDIPWSQIVSLRHRLIHGYDTINLDILWKILTDDLPPLIAQLEKIEYP
ncbi:MAG: DUF86 domain-containing protein [Syntrophales bacterium]|nr:DUF86 domain-containing protein [Syntrophales bacterium]MDD5642783.1 DUF86 domain-containing protein [Syntrophales bacterium]